MEKKSKFFKNTQAEKQENIYVSARNLEMSKCLGVSHSSLLLKL